MRAFKTINTDNYDVQKVQDNVAIVFSDLAKIPLLSGTIVQATLNNTTDTNVEHGLGRNPIGYFAIGCNPPGASIYESSTPNTLKSKFLLLRATATTTLNIWIF